MCMILKGLMLNSSFALLFHSRPWTRTTFCQTKDPIFTRRLSSRPMSTQQPTIPHHLANLTTNPTPHPHHAEPTTTVTTAETESTNDSLLLLPPSPKRTPVPWWHKWTNVTWNVIQSLAMFFVHRHLPAPCSLFCLVGFVFSGCCFFCFGTFHQEMWIWTTKPGSW